MNKDTRFILGVILILVGLFYKPGSLDILIAPKLDKPSPEVVDQVNTLPEISNKVDTSKLSGLFFALSTRVMDADLKSNLDVQYLLDHVGKNVLGTELKGKYPKFAPQAAVLIANTIGPQDSQDLLTEEERRGLSNLLYGFSWKLYDKSEDLVFEDYKNKTITVINDYLGVTPPPPEVVDEDCPCEGRGYIIHGDGHKTECPCIEENGVCNCSGATLEENTTDNCPDGQCSPKVTPKAQDKQYFYYEPKRRGLFRWRR